MSRLPLVLVPGLNCSARLYAPQMPALWAASAGVSVADHRGAASVEEIAAAVLAAAPPRFALAGLSMGGYVAFEMWRRAPERIARLALLDTTARPDTEEGAANRRRLIGVAETGGFASIPPLQIPILLAPANRARADLVATVLAMAEETGAEAYVRQQRAIMARPDSRPTLATITCPTLVLVGAMDELTPPAVAAEIAAGISGARLVEVPGAGHLATLEAPDAVTVALRDWLA